MRIALTLGILALAIPLGCDRDRGSTDVQNNIRSALSAETGLSGVTATVYSDHVRLDGHVASEAERARAEALVRKYAPGRSIEDRLTIGSSGRSDKTWGEKTRDALDTAGEKSRDALDSAAENTRKAIQGAINFIDNLDIRVNGHKVTLRGDAPDEASKERAENIARDNGATDVDNEIRVKK